MDQETISFSDGSSCNNECNNNGSSKFGSDESISTNRVGIICNTRSNISSSSPTAVAVASITMVLQYRSWLQYRLCIVVVSIALALTTTIPIYVIVAASASTTASDWIHDSFHHCYRRPFHKHILLHMIASHLIVRITAIVIHSSTVRKVDADAYNDYYCQYQLDCRIADIATTRMLR